MPGEISEDYNSRPFTLGQQAGRELLYSIQGTEDEDEVRALILSVAPLAYRGLAIENIRAEPLGNGMWKGFATYVRLENDNEFTFDTGGGTVKITQSLFTVNAYGVGGATPPDFRGAIGVSEDRVEGVEITTPAYAWTETHYFDDAIVTGMLKANIYGLTGRTNNALFKGLAAGECLFHGASGNKRGDEKWGITFHFIGSPNATGVTVGDISDIDKGGHDYLWVRYADYVDMTAFALVKKPVAVYVERVYQPGNFSLLLIGT
jgi:hypothetical protein